MVVTANAQVIIPQVWDFDILQARYAKGVIFPRVLNKSDLVKGYGDRVNVPVADSLVGGIFSATGDFTPETLDPTNFAVIVDTWRYISFEIADITDQQSGIDLIKAYSPAIGKRQAEFYDDSLSALHTSLTSNFVGNQDNPERFTDELALPAILKLRDLNVPLEDISWFLPPIAFYEGLYTKDKWTNANTMGLPKSVLTTGFEFPILGAPAYVTTRLATAGINTGSYAALLLHKECMAIAMQLNNKIETTRGVAAAKATTIVLAQTLYGTLVVRQNHGTRIFVKRATSFNP